MIKSTEDKKLDKENNNYVVEIIIYGALFLVLFALIAPFVMETWNNAGISVSPYSKRYELEQRGYYK